MSDILAHVDATTQLVGHNRLEILLFELNDQLFGINVFKIREVMHMPYLTQLPRSHPAVIAATHIRGTTMPVIDLNKAINDEYSQDIHEMALVVTEYNRSVQGLVVHQIQQIVNSSWGDIIPPPGAAGNKTYITGVVKNIADVDDELIELLDVEKILAEVSGVENEPLDFIQMDSRVQSIARKYTVMVADDSLTARSQIKRVLDKIGVNVVLVNDGQEALNFLERDIPRTAGDVSRKYLMLISDVEMPEVDGYSLIRQCRENPGLKNLFIVLNTSITGIFNEENAKKIGCNEFVGKVSSERLYKMVLQQIFERVKKNKPKT